MEARMGRLSKAHSGPRLQ